MRTALIAAMALLIPLAASAQKRSLTCAEDPATQGLFCFAPVELKESAGIRSAPLYTGGPNGITRSPYTVAVNCATAVLHLKDHQGVSFGGAGPGEGTVQSRDLRRKVCAASVALPTPPKKRSAAP